MVKIGGEFREHSIVMSQNTFLPHPYNQNRASACSNSNRRGLRHLHIKYVFHTTTEPLLYQSLLLPYNTLSLLIIIKAHHLSFSQGKRSRRFLSYSVRFRYPSAPACFCRFSSPMQFFLSTEKRNSYSDFPPACTIRKFMVSKIRFRSALDNSSSFLERAFASAINPKSSSSCRSSSAETPS